MSAFERVAETPGQEIGNSPLSPRPGHSELFLISGFSGIGKTAVVNEVQKPIVRQRGYFIKGKYDQFQRNIPFSAFVHAFRDLIGQLLSESDAELEQWKQKLLVAFGEQGQVMLELIPELECLIGAQPPAPLLSGEAAQSRFNRLFQQFVQVFATQKHPLVIFIDDLQWVDSASLKLMTLLLSAIDSQHLLFIGAYRDHEVTPAHPLMLTLDAIRSGKTPVNQITLAPLDRASVNQLVADALKCTPQLAEPLADLVMRKTNGNPFFCSQFLKMLHAEGLIRFDFANGCWECDIATVRSLALTDDVVEFMAHQLQKLPSATQAVLTLAACIGNQFDLETLAIVGEKSQAETVTALWKALQDGLILPQSEVYKFFQSEYSEANQEAPRARLRHDSSTERNQASQSVNQREPEAIAGGFTSATKTTGFKHNQESAENGNAANVWMQISAACSYKFLHDRVQQAAYTLIPESQRHALHLKIGRLLRLQTSDLEWSDRSFAITNHLNMGSALMVDRPEREALAHLNLRACHHAKLATAYVSAVQYATFGINLLPLDAWETTYDLTLALHQAAAEAAYLTTAFQQAERLIQTIWQQSISPLDCVKSYELAVQVYIAEDQQVKAIETGLEALGKLGVPLVQWESAQSLPSLFTPDELAQKPTMTDPASLAALRILVTIMPPVHHVKPDLFPSMTLTLLDLCDRGGYSALAAFAYGSYGLFLGALMGDPEAAHRAGQLSLAILEYYPAPELRAKVNMLFAVFVCAYKEAGHRTLALLKQGIEVGLDAGDIEHASYSVMAYFTHLLLTGQPLETVEQHQKTYLELLHKYKQEHCIEYAHVWLRLTQQWMQDDRDHRLMQDQAEQLQHFETTHNHQCLFALHLAALIATYTFGDRSTAVAHAQAATKSEKAAFGILLEVAHNFYYSLALLGQWEGDDASADRAAALQQVAVNQIKMQNWATHAPMNCQHKYDLVEAEWYRIQGQKAEAMDRSDRAIAGAKAHEYVQEEALANELAANFYLKWGKERLAQDYLLNAYYAYARWGAQAKVLDLEERYPRLLTLILQQTRSPIVTHETLVMTSTSRSAHPSGKKLATSDSSGISATLDLKTILKTSQVLASAIQLEQLLTTLLDILLANAGADKCALLLLQEGSLMIQAMAQVGQPSTVLQALPLADCQDLPISLINTVNRTQQPSVIMDATVHPSLLADRYILCQQPKSLLCLPILHQGKLLGVLYLENKLTVSAFTHDRVELLHLLCAQAAISLENAALYQQSQEHAQKLVQSLETLQQTQLQLVQSEKMSALGSLVAGVAHEINNPVGFIAGNITPAKDYVQDLLGLLDLYQAKFPQPDAELEAAIDEIDLDYVRTDLPKLLESMTLGVDRIRQISTSLRTFSRADKDYKVPFNLHDGIDSSILILKHRLKANETRPEIAVIKTYGELPPVECFAGQLNQVFMNLLANAIDALEAAQQESNHATLPQITIHTAMNGDHQVIIRIADNGVGMSEAVRQQVFDHLFTTKPVGQGTGLGLAIARQIIVDKHQGTIAVNSTPGQGTEFVITLPV